MYKPLACLIVVWLCAQCDKWRNLRVELEQLKDLGVSLLGRKRRESRVSGHESHSKTRFFGLHF